MTSPPPSPAPEAEERHFFSAVNTLLLTSLLLLSLSSSLLVRQCLPSLRRFLPESMMAVLFGMLGGLVARLAFPGQELAGLTFQPEVFFFLVLPPIVFDAGFRTIRKRLFFQNLQGIVLFAGVGTLVSTLVVGLICFGFAKISAIRIDPASPLQALLFGSLISSVDPVATLSILGDASVNQDLYSLVFGESVLNDAVAISLFQVFLAQDPTTFGLGDIGHVLARFVAITLGSITIGLGIGLLWAFMFKRVDALRDHPVLEVQLLIFGAFLSFSLAEAVEFSGVTSLFLTGIIFSHYLFHSLSPHSQTSSVYLFEAMAKIAEMLCFVTLGLSLLTTNDETRWDGGFVVVALLAIALARAAHIFPLSAAANLCRRKERQIPLRMQVVLFLGGFRGAVSFALSLQLDSSVPGVPEIQSTTLLLVLITTVFLGATSSTVIDRLQMDSSTSSSSASVMPEDDDVEVRRGGGGEDFDVATYEAENRGWLAFDRNYMQPLFGGGSSSSSSSMGGVASAGASSAHAHHQRSESESFHYHQGSTGGDDGAVHMELMSGKEHEDEYEHEHEHEHHRLEGQGEQPR